MASQIRYFDYMAPITSKSEGEHIALSVGIGPLLGFDRATIDMGTGSLVITSSNDDSNLPIKNTDLYISNVDMAIHIPSHIVITPDGILTTVQGALNISFNPSQVGTYKEFILMANHTYSPMEGGTVTTFTCIPNTTNSSMLSKLISKEANIKTWYDIANTLGNIEKNKSVIVGFYSVDSSNLVTAYNPYKNRWPQPYPLTIVELGGILNSIRALEYNQASLEGIVADMSNQDKPSYREYINFEVGNPNMYTLGKVTGYIDGLDKTSLPGIEGKFTSWDLTPYGSLKGLLSIQRLSKDNIKISGRVFYRFTIPTEAKDNMDGSSALFKFRLFFTVTIKKQWVGLDDLSGFNVISAIAYAGVDLETRNGYTEFFSPPDINTVGSACISNGQGSEFKPNKNREYMDIFVGSNTAYVVPEKVTQSNILTGKHEKPNYVNSTINLEISCSR